FLRLSPVEAVGLGLIAFLTWWNTTSVRNGAVVQNIFTTAKVFALLGLLVACLVGGGKIVSGDVSWGMEPALTMKAPLFLPFAVAAVQPLFAADSWNNVTFLSEEVRDPENNLPRALLLG